MEKLNITKEKLTLGDKEKLTLGDAYFCQGGTFAASRNAVRHTPLAQYVAIRDEVIVGPNSEAGHYLERSWFKLLGVDGSLRPAPRVSMVLYTIDTRVWKLAVAAASGRPVDNNNNKSALSWWMPSSPCKEASAPPGLVCYWYLLVEQSTSRMLILAGRLGWTLLNLPHPPPAPQNLSESRQSSLQSSNLEDLATSQRTDQENLAWTIFEAVLNPKSMPTLATADYTCFLEPGASKDRVQWSEISLAYRKNLHVATIALISSESSTNDNVSTLSNVRRQSQESDELGRAWFVAFTRRWRVRERRGAQGACDTFAAVALLALQDVDESWETSGSVAGLPVWLRQVAQSRLAVTEQNWCRQRWKARGNTFELAAAATGRFGKQRDVLGNHATRRGHATQRGHASCHDDTCGVVGACSATNWLPLTGEKASASASTVSSSSVLPLQHIELVVAHCTRSLSWLSEATATLRQCGANVRAVHIYSKCNMTHTIGPLQRIARLVVLPNTGRNDHTYAYHLASRDPAQPPPPLTFFLKDSSMLHPGNSFIEDIVPLCTQVANARLPIGFGCGRYPIRTPHPAWMSHPRVRALINGTSGSEPELASAWHHMASLRTFQLSEYDKAHDQSRKLPNTHKARRSTSTEHSEKLSEDLSPQRRRLTLIPTGDHFPAICKPLGKWLSKLVYNGNLASPCADTLKECKFALEIAHAYLLQLLQRPIVPVCYGGTFVAAGSSIDAVPPAVWRALMHSLERGENIEEGNYAERIWAALLTTPAAYVRHEQSLACAAHRLVCTGKAFRGMLTTCVPTSHCSVLGRSMINSTNASMCPLPQLSASISQELGWIISGRAPNVRLGWARGQLCAVHPKLCAAYPNAPGGSGSKVKGGVA